MAKKGLVVFLMFLFLGFTGAQEHSDEPHQEKQHKDSEQHGEMSEDHDTSANLSDYTAEYSFKLIAELVDGKMVYTGVGGDIDGVQNPTLEVKHGAVVEITLVNASVLEHDLVLTGLGAHAEHVAAEGDTAVFAFEASTSGEFTYYCSVAGHKEAGMLGTLIVDEAS